MIDTTTNQILYVFDPVTGNEPKTIEVTEEWTEPEDWQDPRPTPFTRADVVYVSNPATRQIHLVDLDMGAVVASATLDQESSELSGAVGHHH